MIQKGDTVKWRTVNGYASGIVTDERGNGQWLVTLGDGRVVIVSEESMKKE